MNEKNESSEKIISLYKFIAEFCKAKNRIIKNDKNYMWSCKIEDIPEDDENITISYYDRTEDEAEETNDRDNYILKVHKPELQKCPTPPVEIKNWLINGWDYFKEPVKIKKEIEIKTGNQLEKISFDSDEERVRKYNDWILKRKNWVEIQEKLDKTRKFFTELYNNYVDLEKDSETKEIIIANGYIKDKNNPEIFHPILTKRLEIKFDALENTIYIINTNAKSELYTELFQIMEDINLDAMSTLTSDLAQNDYHPMDRNDTAHFFKVLAHKISSNSRYVDYKEEDIDDDNRITILYKPVFILRNKIDGTVKTIEQIIRNIEETNFIPPHLIDIIAGGILEKAEETEESFEEVLAKTGGESLDILLTKEANKEQLEIAKRIEMYNAVLVQGPPGTGKTHTIANLIGNFLANGKSVLVTSYTKKALNVLKDKLPKSMRSLCVSVLDESNDDMEKSIDGITEYMSKHTSYELNKDKEKLKQSRIEVISELSKTRKKIYNALNSEYKSIVLNGEEISPTDAALFILNNKDKLDYINGKIKLYSPLPLSIEELNYLYSTNNKITHTEENELNFKLPNPDDLIKPKLYEEHLLKIDNLMKNIESIALQNKWKVSLEHDVFFQTNFGDFYVPDLDGEKLNALAEFIKKYKNTELWCRNICCDGRKDGAHKKRWKTLIKDIRNVVELNESIIDNYFGKKISCEIGELLNNENLIIKLKELLSKNDKISKLDLLFKNDLKKMCSLNVINDKPIRTKEDCDFLLKSIDLYKLRKQLSVIWDDLMSQYGVPKFFDLDDNEPEIIAEKYVGQIEYYLEWYSNEYKLISKYLKNANIPEHIVFQINNLDKDLEQINKIFDAIEKKLPHIIQICINRLQMNEIQKNINHTIDILDDNMLINSSLCVNLKNALINKNTEKYLSDFKELELTYNKYETLYKRNNLLEKIYEVAPSWANDIKNRIGIHGGDSCPQNITEAWKYKQLDLILDDLTKDSLESLQNKSRKLSYEYREVTEKYAEKSAWYELLSKTECDIDMKQALKGWELTVKKIGKGTGKNAAKHKAKARELMAICQKAVPCWIMPINKAIESLIPGKNQFDVIIIDEASQSDISALAIAYLGKKMIVVGDDKQVSPMAVGLELDKINALEQMYIKGKIPNSHLYSSKTSLYDIAATTFQPLMLKEHFRCVPEIIGFSNMLSYDFKIKPLRDSGSNKLSPAIINYRVDGKRVGKENKVEAETIVSFIKSCITLEEYADKTFGVISLLGDEQVKLIQKLLQRTISLRDIQKRKILVGNASNFQGDERDIIFLSMVDSRNEDGVPLSLSSNGPDDSTKKRYNVAVSRAKDQLWVVHSLDAAYDLKDGDIRKRLLDYTSNPNSIEIKREEIKKKADSIFEVQVAEKLVSEGYHIIQQYPVGAYKLDIVAIYKNNKVVIECDGESYHSGDEKVREDMQRQAILERIGWKFIRIRGSKYFRNPEKEMNLLIEQLNSMNIYPEDEIIEENVGNFELVEKVKQNAEKYLKKLQQDNNDFEIDNDDILFALDSNKNRSIDIPLNFYGENAGYTEIRKMKENVILGPSQFRYMVLFCNGITRREISEYYNVEYDTVKKSLQVVSKNYNAELAEECKEQFKKDYENTEEYQQIIKEYFNNKKKKIEILDTEEDIDDYLYKIFNGID